MNKKNTIHYNQYAPLKAEMQEIVAIQSNYIIAMYTITVAIIGIGLQFDNVWLLLLPYVVLFSFQRIIQAKKDVMLRIAAYIVVFLDGPDGFEKNYIKIVNKTTNRFSQKKPYSWLRNVVSGRISSLQLGALCSSLCIIKYLLTERNGKLLLSEWSENYTQITFIDTLPILAALGLFILLWYKCRDALCSMRDRANYIRSLKNWKKNRNKRNKKRNKKKNKNNKKRSHKKKPQKIIA